MQVWMYRTSPRPVCVRPFCSSPALISATTEENTHDHPMSRQGSPELSWDQKQDSWDLVGRLPATIANHENDTVQNICAPPGTQNQVAPAHTKPPRWVGVPGGAHHDTVEVGSEDDSEDDQGEEQCHAQPAAESAELEAIASPVHEQAEEVAAGRKERQCLSREGGGRTRQGAVVAMKAVEHTGQGRCLSHEGGGYTRRGRCRCHEGSGTHRALAVS